jgi:hypothetical protein
MAYSNVGSRRLSAGSDRLRKMMPFVLFLSGWTPGSAHAQLVEQDVFTTASYDVECTFARSGGPELSCDRFGERHLRFVLGPTGHAQILTIPSTEGCCSRTTRFSHREESRGGVLKNRGPAQTATPSNYWPRHD